MATTGNDPKYIRGPDGGLVSDPDDYTPEGWMLLDLHARINQLEIALRRALDELGIPSPDYPAPVVKAIEIINSALLGG